MSTIIAYIALTLILAAVLLVAAAPVLPTVFNVAIVGLVAYRTTKRWLIRIPLFIALSALISWNLRIPTLISDHFGSAPQPEVKIGRAVTLGFNEKVSLRIAAPEVYYRRGNHVPSWGFNGSGGSFELGVKKVPMIVENPADALRSANIPVSSEDGQRVSIEVRSSIASGFNHIDVTVRDELGVAATLRHAPRVNFPLEKLDRSGQSDSNWLGSLAFIAQKTPWNPTKDYYPHDYAPIKEFLAEALLQRGPIVSGGSVGVTADSLDKASVPVEHYAVVSIKSLRENEVEKPYQPCVGEASGMPFDVGADVSVSIAWGDKDFPPIHVPRTPVDGNWPALNAAGCSGNGFWVSSNSNGFLRVWQYEANFESRSVILRRRVKVAFPEEIATEIRAQRQFLVSSIANAEKNIGFDLAYHERDPRSGRYVFREGYRVLAVPSKKG